MHRRQFAATLSCVGLSNCLPLEVAELVSFDVAGVGSIKDYFSRKFKSRELVFLSASKPLMAPEAALIEAFSRDRAKTCGSQGAVQFGDFKDSPLDGVIPPFAAILAGACNRAGVGENSW
jgi:hypothetical protein